MEQRFISMDNEKDIKLSGKITIEETKELLFENKKFLRGVDFRRM